jgi:hypothetical protein
VSLLAIINVVFTITITTFTITTITITITITKIHRTSARKFSSTTTTSSSQQQQHAFVLAKRKLKTEGFYKKNWFSDPSTYPLVVTMGAAFALVTGVGSSCLLYNPDVQINPQTRGSIMRPK